MLISADAEGYLLYLISSIFQRNLFCDTCVLCARRICLPSCVSCLLFALPRRSDADILVLFDVVSLPYDVALCARSVRRVVRCVVMNWASF